MSKPALDREVHIALRDEQKAEKFAQHIADLAAQIINATFKFSQNVTSAYELELIPKRRLSDKHFSEIDQAKLALGAFSFFIHVLDRYMVRMNTQTMRDTVFDFIFEKSSPAGLCEGFHSPASTNREVRIDSLRSSNGPACRSADHLWRRSRGQEQCDVARGSSDL